MRLPYQITFCNLLWTLLWYNHPNYLSLFHIKMTKSPKENFLILFFFYSLITNSKYKCEKFEAFMHGFVRCLRSDCLDPMVYEASGRLFKVCSHLWIPNITTGMVPLAFMEYGTLVSGQQTLHGKIWLWRLERPLKKQCWHFVSLSQNVRQSCRTAPTWCCDFICCFTILL